MCLLCVDGSSRGVFRYEPNSWRPQWVSQCRMFLFLVIVVVMMMSSWSSRSSLSWWLSSLWWRSSSLSWWPSWLSRRWSVGCSVLSNSPIFMSWNYSPLVPFLHHFYISREIFRCRLPQYVDYPKPLNNTLVNKKLLHFSVPDANYR